jgi:biotin synthase
MWHSGSNYDADWARRYSQEELVARAVKLEESGISKTYIPSGWMGQKLPDYFYENIRAIKSKTKLKLIGFFGTASLETLQKLKDAGIDGYWTGLEVMNEATFHKVRPGDSLQARLETLRNTRKLGLEAWSSFLLGIGEIREDIAREISFLKEVGASNVMVVNFKPSPFTRWEKATPPSPYYVAEVMAITRIVLGKINIMSFAGMGNIEWGIRAGANSFVTSYPWEMSKIASMRRTLYANKSLG